MSHFSDYKVKFILVLILMTLIEFMAHALRNQMSMPTVFESVSVAVFHRVKETYFVFRLEKVGADIVTKPQE